MRRDFHGSATEHASGQESARSIAQTLPRTLLTTGTTLVSALLLASFGGATIRPLALVMSFGIAVGTLSSIFVASPVLLWLSRREGMPAGAEP